MNSEQHPRQPIHLLPEKRRRSLSRIPRRLYLAGWLTIAVALGALVAVYLFLKHIGIA